MGWRFQRSVHLLPGNRLTINAEGRRGQHRKNADILETKAKARQAALYGWTEKLSRSGER